MLEMADDFVYLRRDGFTPIDSLPQFFSPTGEKKFPETTIHRDKVLLDYPEWLKKYPGG